jgi:hypothetical protein
MANGVHTSVNAKQPAAFDPPLDRVLTHAESQELGPGNDPVLPPREVGNRPLAGVLRNLTAHYAVK